MKRQLLVQLAVGMLVLVGTAGAQTAVEPLPVGNGEAGCPSASCQRVCRCGATGHATHHHARSNLKTRLQASHWGYPSEFIEAPLGASLRCLMHAQIANGVAADMVLYRYDFYGLDTPYVSALSPRGRLELMKIARAIPYMPGVVLIEATGDAALDASRRAHVLEQLAEVGVVLDADQVRSGVPPAPGLAGPEAMLIYQGQLDAVKPQAGGGPSAGGGPLQLFSPAAGAQPPTP